MKYLIGNWKSQKTLSQAQAWLEAVKQQKMILESPLLQVVLCPSLIHLSLFPTFLPELAIGVQSLSPYEMGAYTGVVSASMLEGLAKFALLGHAERRKYFRETDQDVVQQVLRALESSLTPILAVDDANWATLLSQFEAEQVKKILVMYEPPSAISTSSNAGGPADLLVVKRALQLIKSKFPIKAGLYGGSVNSANIQLYLKEAEIDGVVPGAASLDATEFGAMIRLAQQVSST